MRIKVLDKEDRLEVSLYFPDSRLVDLEIALRRTGAENRWSFVENDKRLDHVEYEISAGSAFQATVHFTHGLEPPTRAVFENRRSDSTGYSASHKRSVIRAVKEFLLECAARALVSDAQKDRAIVELNRHDTVEV